MNQISHPMPCTRLQEHAFWAKGIERTLDAEYGKSRCDLPSDLQHYFGGTSVESAPINQTDMNRLWHAAAILVQDDCFGLKTGTTYRSNTLEVLKLAAISSATIGDAVQRVIRYFSVFSTQVQLYCVEDEHFLTVYFQPLGTPHPMHMEALLSHCQHLWRALAPSDTSLVLETLLARKNTKRRSLYEGMFGKRTGLGSSRFAVKLNRLIMGMRLPSADAFLAKHLDATLTDMLSTVPNIDFAEQVKQRIRVLVSEREVSEELVASPFNMSSRHLRRKLNETQTTYEQLLDEVRMELAMRLLQDNKLNLGSIALELGFLAPSSFTRAFRRWTGMTPKEFRSKGEEHAKPLPINKQMQSRETTSYR